MKSRLLATLIGLGMLAGCGKALPVASSAVAPPTADSLSLQNHGKGKARLLAGLNLTGPQQRAIRAIFLKAREARQDRQEERAAFRKLITADTIDRDALTAAIENKLAGHDEKVNRKVTMLSAIRDVLTDTQREKLAANLSSMGKGHSLADRQAKIRAKLAKIAEQVKMTDVQKAKFDAVLDAYAAGAEARQERRAAKKAAVAEFLTSGDEAALRTALQAAKPEIPVAAIVDALASLDQGQRQQILAMHMREHRARMAAMCPGTSRSDKLTLADQGEAIESSQEDKDDAKPEQVESGDGQGPDEDRGGEPQPEPQG